MQQYLTKVKIQVSDLAKILHLDDELCIVNAHFDQDTNSLSLVVASEFEREGFSVPSEHFPLLAISLASLKKQRQSKKQLIHELMTITDQLCTLYGIESDAS